MKPRYMSLIAGACLSAAGAACAQNDPTFIVMNRSAAEITKIFVSPAQHSQWGADLLGDKVLRAGGRFRVAPSRDEGCIFDVRVEYPGNRFEERRQQNLCRIETMAFDGSGARVAQQQPRDSEAPQPPAQQGRAQPTSSGSGFFVSAQGHALTNHHVVEGCSSLGAVIDGRMTPVSVVQADRQNDLALIRVQTAQPVRHASFRAGPGIRAGEDVVVAGFPFSHVLQNGLNITRGNVSAMSGIGGNTANMQMTAPVQPGNSGGPLFDMSGNVVGVVVSRLNSRAVRAEAQNINYAVQGTVARLFLEANGVRAAEQTSTQDLRAGDISDAAREFTFQVTCFGPGTMQTAMGGAAH